MKKIIMLLLVCSFSYASFAQTEEKEKEGSGLPNGVRFGFQSSNFVSDTDLGFDDLSRGYIGFVRKIDLIPLIRLETGLEYMIAGARAEEDTELQLHYLVLPAQGVFSLGPFIAQAGISANWRVAENFKLNGEKVDRDDKSASFDFALNAGVGFNIAMLTLEGRYYWGLVEVEDGWYNEYLQAGLKLHF